MTGIPAQFKAAPKGSALARARRFLYAGLVAAALVPLATAASCSAGDDLGPPSPGTGIQNGGPCSDGATRSCHITLDQQNGVLTCYDGVQACIDGTWGACENGSIASRPAPSWPSDDTADVPYHTLSLSDAVPCPNNPCDPTCQTFDEQPDGGIPPTPDGSIYDWPSGDLDDFPPGLVNKGLVEPCDHGNDCQFDHYCYDPTSGSCSHSKCSVGAPLVSGCDPCVTSICAVDPTCCSNSFGGGCAHSPCSTGGKLSKFCDNCVQAICNADPYCCNTQWDSICVNEVASICGKSCNPGSWTQACVDKVYSVCNAFCQEDPGCAHDKCYEGPPLTAACDACVTKICAVDPFCCASSWDAQCVAQVDSVCSQSCDAEGTCIPWLPGQTNPNCPGVDLTAGVPCNNTIPICNHGNTTAPAGIKIIHFPANSQQYPKCAPDQSHPQMMTCTTSQPIPPGTCISVTNCPGLIGNREIMVNPPGAAHVAECSCTNNWSLYSGSNACSPPSCAIASSEASLKKVNMFVAVDKSGSMQWNGWTEAMNALKTFFQSADSAGLGVALRFWPDNAPVNGCSSPSCSTNACASPLVPLGTLTSSAAPADAQEQALVTAINGKSPNGGTPMYPALAGATQWATNYQNANPNEKTVVVFVTDGEPTECNTNINQIAALASNAFNSAGVLTYAIGIEGADVAAVNKIAASGQTGQAFLVQKGQNNSQVETQLLAALNAIKGESVSCDLILQSSGILNPDDVSVIYTPGAGQPTFLPEVSGAQACGGGWYFDDPNNPTKITLCQSTCNAAKSDIGAKIEVSIGCPPKFEPETIEEIYSGSCPPGTKLQWGFFAYDTSIPGDASVIFQAQTSTNPASFPAQLLTLATAGTASQVCPMVGPAPCPVNLFNKLGGIPNAQNEYLKLVIKTNPTTDKSGAPTINNWEITYSCPASE
ncbi:MAG: VWA domain-containing protein [Polyangiaceae bacterium]|nr:VWA domain-containing protein [Polyangiaceae bacterium]